VNRYSLTHVPDSVLLRDLHSLLARECATTAALLAHLAEVDVRRLYAAAGYPSMFAYCIEQLHLSEEAAYKRIRVARVARQFPVVFEWIADGRLHTSGVVILAAHLTPENADELFAAATHQSTAGIERVLAERFPRPDLPARIEALTPPTTFDLSAPGRVESADQQLSPGTVEVTDEPSAPGRIESADGQLSPGTVGPRARVAPLAPGRYGVQFTMGQATYERLRHAQSLLGHSVPSGNLSEVFDRALDALIVRLEQRKYAATTRPHQPQRSSANPRHVPAEVRRAVWQRDGGRCTFVSAAGHRCEARTRLEFDHVEPVARGGRATVKGLRLRCRAHNQYAAECTFGADFMNGKREAAQRGTARRAAEEARARAAAAAEEARIRAAAAAQEVVPWLQALGFRASEARRAAASCEAIPDAPLEERVRVALSRLAPGRVRRGLDGRGWRPSCAGEEPGSFATSVSPANRRAVASSA
jgi:hypothetical protein